MQFKTLFCYYSATAADKKVSLEYHRPIYLISVYTSRWEMYIVIFVKRIVVSKGPAWLKWYKNTNQYNKHWQCFYFLLWFWNFLYAKMKHVRLGCSKPNFWMIFFQDASLAVLQSRLHIYSIQSQQQGYCVTWKLVS